VYAPPDLNMPNVVKDSSGTARRSGPLVLILPHLGIGGAQRVASTLANYWASRGLDVHVVTTMEDKDDFYNLHTAVRRHTV